jgi:LuxR family maltose regulon positive regulatory protein
VRTVLDEGGRCRELLVELSTAGTTEAGLGDRIRQLLHKETAPRPPSPTTAADPALSAREQQILALLAQGLSNKEIARSIAVDPNTVKYHLKRLFAKLAVERRARAVIRARQYGLIE